MIPVRDYMKNKAVKKTLTIPKWLNDVALESNVNFFSLASNSNKRLLRN